MIKTFVALSLVLTSTFALAAPVTYKIDPNHTYPSIEVDHKGGLSVWRGKFKKTTGSVVYDKEGKAGSVEVVIDMNSIEFGHDDLNEHVKSKPMLDTATFPTATYKGTFTKFNGDSPAEVTGELTLHGVTKPVKLTINTFKCIMDGMTKHYVCGADITGSINRDEFGIDLAKGAGWSMATKLLISVEAIKPD